MMRGRRKAKSLGVADAYIFVRKGLLSLQDAAAQAGISEAAFRAAMDR